MVKNFKYIALLFSMFLASSCFEKLLPGESSLKLTVENQSPEDVYCDIYSKKKGEHSIHSETSSTYPIKLSSSETKRIICYVQYDDNQGKTWKWPFYFNADTILIVFDRREDRILNWNKSQDDHLIDKVLRYTIDDVPPSNTLFVIYDMEKDKKE